MKKLAGLGLVLVLLALASPVLAGPGPYCWTIEGTSCPSVGQTKTCMDTCFFMYTCTCISWNGQRYWDCPEVC